MAAYHPTGLTVEIVGIESSNNGRSQEDQAALKLDSVVRLRKVQVVVDEAEEPAIAAYRISDGVDQGRIGFLGKWNVPNWKRFEGKIAQITEFYKTSESPTKRRKHRRNSGVCLAAIIDSVHPGDDSVEEEDNNTGEDNGTGT